jgi:hypothetical protein
LFNYDFNLPTLLNTEGKLPHYYMAVIAPFKGFGVKNFLNKPH